jgi:hypothetical protein
VLVVGAALAAVGSAVLIWQLQSGLEVRWYVMGGLELGQSGKVQIREDPYQPKGGEPSPAEITRLARQVDSSFFAGIQEGSRTRLGVTGSGAELKGVLYQQGFESVGAALSSFELTRAWGVIVASVVAIVLGLITLAYGASPRRRQRPGRQGATLADAHEPGQDEFFDR